MNATVASVTSSNTFELTRNSLQLHRHCVERAKTFQVGNKWRMTDKRGPEVTPTHQQPGQNTLKEIAHQAACVLSLMLDVHNNLLKKKIWTVLDILIDTRDDLVFVLLHPCSIFQAMLDCHVSTRHSEGHVKQPTHDLRRNEKQTRTHRAGTAPSPTQPDLSHTKHANTHPSRDGFSSISAWSAGHRYFKRIKSVDCWCHVLLFFSYHTVFSPRPPVLPCFSWVKWINLEVGQGYAHTHTHTQV